MTRTFQATLLLADGWVLDTAAIASKAREMFPAIGAVDTLSAPEGDQVTGVLTLDSAEVRLVHVNAPLAEADLSPTLSTLKTWEPGNLVRDHCGQLTISCGGDDLDGLDGAKAYAAACHFVAAAAATIAPTSAVFWRTGWALSEASAFVDAARSLERGRIPTVSWISFATIVPAGGETGEVAGMVTYGLRPFIGRELELAPRHGSPRIAFRILNGVLREVLTLGTEITEGRKLQYAMDDLSMIARLRTRWLRKGVPAIVLVTNDSILDSETLRPVQTA